MSDETTQAGSAASDEAKIAGIADQVKADIQVGHVDDDVSAVLQQRLIDAGLEVRPEKVEELASDIENDAAR